ncbi:MAG: stage 0 sporulation family protein [Lachnospira sp.]|nr:stage 0 sporulation family protein [Lachnospira sp.]
MTKVIGVRFRRAGKIYFFAPGRYNNIEVGQNVIVETARGVEYGHVVLGEREVSDESVIQPLKAVIRIATPEDDEREQRNREKEKEAYGICLEKIKKHNLDMKLIQVEYTFDNNKVLFYFTAEGRIDFRELVKDLAAVFKTRIELRQVGVRDEAKIMGGIGVCGRPLCCATYLPEFVPVSIKMAKEQNLSLNPTKISGVCGRLMCCLKNEEEAYEHLNSKLPNVGDIVTTVDNLKGEVSSVNVLRQRVKITITHDNDEKEIKEYSVDEIKFKPKKRYEKVQINDQELRELEELERREGKSRMNNDD